jgi:SNF2 family DNA or RNA helicase
MTDGCILGHDTGLGKTLAAFAIPIIKGARRVLIVSPSSLHLQLKETARTMFMVPLLPLENQTQFWQWNLDKPPPEGREKPVFYYTDYHALGRNGADEWPNDTDEDGVHIEVKALKTRRLTWIKENLGEDHVQHYHTYTAGIGHTSNDIRCVWDPTLARLIRYFNSFDSVVLDEGTRLQSNDAKIAIGVRMLNPKHRLILSATPIKNRLDSLFWLAWWAAGGTEDANCRWPYKGTTKERELFASQHLQHDRFLDREDEANLQEGSNRTIKKRTARITNIHKLWKLTAPIILRRRKADCGEDIVPRRSATIRCKPSAEQLEVYRHHLLNPPPTESGRSATGMQLMQLLRVATLCPSAPSLLKAGKAAASPLTPKTLAILTLIEDRLSKGEQVLVGSNFHEWGTLLHDILHKAGVKVTLLDGRVCPKKRAHYANDFKQGKYSVLIGGLASMGEGHSFDHCANLFLPSLDYAPDVNQQFVDRIWRLTTAQPINVYTFLTEGTIDEYLIDLFTDKRESSALALDGCLRPDDINDEESVEALLQKAIDGFRPDTESVTDEVVKQQFESLRPRLEVVQKAFERLRL